MEINDIPRDSDGKLPAFAWPGGYQIIYFDNEGNTLCPDCANKSDMASIVIAGDIYYEGPAIQCDDCNKKIESSYGDPEETK